MSESPTSIGNGSVSSSPGPSTYGIAPLSTLPGSSTNVNSTNTHTTECENATNAMPAGTIFQFRNDQSTLVFKNANRILLLGQLVANDGGDLPANTVYPWRITAAEKQQIKDYGKTVGATSHMKVVINSTNFCILLKFIRCK